MLSSILTQRFTFLQLLSFPTRRSSDLTVEVPNVDALVRSKIDAAIAANPTDWQIPLAVANAYWNDDKLDEAMKWTDQSIDRKSTRLNSSHRCISYAVFCLKKKKKKE